jgi:transposase InsO family protein
MPWKTRSLLEARLRLVQAALRQVHSLAELCRQAGVSRKTGYKWLRRFRTEGTPGLRDRSRRPQHSPSRTPARWLEAVRQVRRRRPTWGGKKIYAWLRRRHPHAHLPRPRTIARWLRRWGAVRRWRRTARPGPPRPRPALTIPTRPNQVWTVDFKGWFRTGDGRRVVPLTVRDLFSRFVLGIRLLRHRHPQVQRYFQRLFARYGLPEIIRIDHGPPFAGDGALELSRLSAWWLSLGIRVELTGRARPQDNAAHEPRHRIYQNEVARRPAPTPAAQQRRTDRWRHHYNWERPHEALGQRVPAERYRRSRRRYPAALRPWRYPSGWRTARVTASGYVRWRGRLRVIGRAFGGQRVGFQAVGAGVHEVYFANYLIGLLVDSDRGGMRPAHWSQAAVASTPP